MIRPILPLATTVLLAASAAHAQDCGTAMPAFRAALDANTAEAVAGFIEAHPGCFTAPAEAKLAALGGAPDGTAVARYEGPPIGLSALGVGNFFGARAIAADDDFWTGAVPDAGAFTVDLRPSYGGLSPFDVGPALASGEADAAFVFPETMFQVDGSFGDVLAGLDVPFAAASPAEARAILGAVRPVAERVFADAGLVLLAAPPLMPRVLLCGGDTAVRGARIRAWGTRGNGYEALGAQTVSLPFSEVAGALQRDVIDCVDTTTGIAMLVGLHRTGGTVAPAPASGLGATALVMNAQTWERMPQDARDALSAAAADFETALWDRVEQTVQADLDCMTGRGSCPAGVEPGNLTALPAPQISETDRRAAEAAVLRSWAEAGGKTVADSWQAAAGSVR